MPAPDDDKQTTEGPAAGAAVEAAAAAAEDVEPMPPAALRQELGGMGAGVGVGGTAGVGVGGAPPTTNPPHHSSLPWYSHLDVFRFCRCLRLLGSVMCIIVLLLFGVSWWAVAVGVYGPVVRGVGPRGEGASAAGRAGAALLIASFTGLCALALWSYFVAVGTDAGRVPAGWHPFEDDAAAEAELRRMGVVVGIGVGGEDDDGDGGAAAADEEGGGGARDPHALPPAGSPFHHNHPGAGALLFPHHHHLHHHNNTIHQRQSSAAAAPAAFAAQAPPQPVPYTGDPRDPRRPRWCRKCHSWKPPRSHHCSASGRCVLKMDHYCIWVVNCVGLLNYKAFFLFLLYTGLASAFAAAALVPPAVRFFSTLAPDGSLAIAFVALAMDGAFAIALAAFVGMHANLVRAGCTTIEMYEKERPSRWPYQRGSFVLNLEDVCGPRPWVGGVGGGGFASSSGVVGGGGGPRGGGGWRRVAEAARWLFAPSHSREATRALLEECLGPQHGALEERRRFLAASNGGVGGEGGVGGGGVAMSSSSNDNAPPV